ncbi:hypothetical protein RDI58_021208 [Solanum bulbocastanum]|uniref:UBX domain-containing protein n=1 Tax=Solanum bulbocastanum TaxID=147425 RepID=A0AAN8TGN2_SOLBU
MASVPSSLDMLISSFLDVAVDQTVDTAGEFLQATNWNLEEAIQRFFSVNNNGGAGAAAESFNYSPLIEDNPTLWESEDDDSDVRLSLPVKICVPGMVQPETLLEDAMAFIDCTPSEYHSDLLRKQFDRLNHGDRIEEGTDHEESKEDENDQNELLMNTNTIYLPMPEEPNRSLISNCDKNLVCRIAIRLPDGRRIQRNFMKSDPIKLLWCFCSTQLEEAKTRAFRFRQAMPGPTRFWASNFWNYDSNLTFEESGLDNSVIALVMT